MAEIPVKNQPSMKDPAKNPEVDQSWVYGIRARLIF